MPSKKKLKRRNKKLKKELAEREEMYTELQDDYHGYVDLYHDVIKLLAEFDNVLLRRVVDIHAPGYTIRTMDSGGPAVFHIDDSQDNDLTHCLICENMVTTQFICVYCCNNNPLLNDVVKYLQQKENP